MEKEVTLKEHMKRIRGLVKNNARSKKQARAAALARWKKK